ncbi:hypothetical protein B0I33_107283 [Prauserella shujinwangii]|uniref:Uncharacterized protein n=2 Tax=Prauserella shujinwangii TaxID=1453103 RepID=A0A2T0LSW6_9PSEU|nr:hypothetical protein B0I33_107283 [Prauserella shujinwangii]
MLAGTGMLSEVAQVLAGDGWRVVLPCRRYSPLPAPEELISASAPPGRASHARPDAFPDPGKAVWVEAHWDRPRELARKTEKVLTAPAGLLVAWVHETYRRSVLGAVEPLLASAAPVVEVRALADLGRIPDEPDPLLVGHPTQQVLLGSVSEQDPRRPLAHDEIVDGVLVAVRRALAGRHSSLHQVGQRRGLPVR